MCNKKTLSFCRAVNMLLSYISSWKDLLKNQPLRTDPKQIQTRWAVKWIVPHIWLRSWSFPLCKWTRCYGSGIEPVVHPGRVRSGSVREVLADSGPCLLSAVLSCSVAIHRLFTLVSCAYRHFAHVVQAVTFILTLYSFILGSSVMSPSAARV